MTGVDWPRRLDLAAIDVLLCDADGNLFPSEEPAFVASTEVTNRFMAGLGLDRRFEPEELRLATTGKNFRTTAVDLAVEGGIGLDATLADRHPSAARGAWRGHRVLTAQELEVWVAEERRQVTSYLGEVLAPDLNVYGPLRRLRRRTVLAAVSSSAAERLTACFRATGLSRLFPAERRFSAEDSLPVPTSKPDPAIYRYAGRALGATHDRALAIEDSVPGAQSAVAAGFPTLGNVLFVAPGERPQRTAELLDAGALGVLESWEELEQAFAAAPVSSREQRP
jgi:HAD superfamily hydrolase (TIGR01509 family)